MFKMFDSAKLIISWVASIFINMIGGCDESFSLMISLIIADFIAGVVNAIKTKSLSSAIMRDGIIKKLLVCMVIVLAVRVDNCIIGAVGEPITIAGKDMYARTLFIIYFCLEEAVSLLENLTKLGIPTPKWLRGILHQVTDYTNTSTPKAIVSWLKNKFGISIKLNTTEPEKKEEELPQSNEENSEEGIDKG